MRFLKVWINLNCLGFSQTSIGAERDVAQTKQSRLKQSVPKEGFQLDLVLTF